jgi:[CysO sulfur-carrier protein]-S-L-cysteine hydrolase
MNPLSAFTLVPGLGDDIIAHARAGYPHEVCGLIGGDVRRGVILRRAVNVSPAPATRFDIDLLSLAQQAAWEDAGLALAAVYHSHPHGPSTPSSADTAGVRDAAVLHIICNLADPARPALHAFRIEAGLTYEVILKT